MTWCGSVDIIKYLNAECWKKKLPEQMNAKLGKGTCLQFFQKGSKCHKIHSLFIQRGIFLFVSKLYFICKSSNIILWSFTLFHQKRILCCAILPLKPNRTIAVGRRRCRHSTTQASRKCVEKSRDNILAFLKKKSLSFSNDVSMTLQSMSSGAYLNEHSSIILQQCNKCT